MKKEDIDKRIGFLNEELEQLKKVRKNIDKEDKGLLGKIGKIIAKRLNADIPENVATRTCLYDPIMEEIRPLFNVPTKENKETVSTSYNSQRHTCSDCFRDPRSDMRCKECSQYYDNLCNLT